ncbi:MAG: CCA tRNA nucleotidyltransferase, partial [Alphaproteobacteria bacterium]|nr:CCA tRNA nucleotidyltransferase [Alphaproteobacteria bacterium]
MTAPETLAVMNALIEARFVGGAVRNALLGVPVSDIDIAVPMPPAEAMTRLKAAGIRTIPTGMDHGTVTAVIAHHAFEVTSLRRDVKTDGRHATIAFTDDWAEDAARRDFTFNALYAGADGEIFDYATGVEDLIAGRVRFMGNPATRIAEDYLRILRLFRFHAWYGKGELDERALRAAATAKEMLASLSAERIAKEMLRLLEALRPGPVLRVMAATGILSEVLPGELEMARLERLCEIETENGYEPDALLRLAALLKQDKGATMAERWKLSNTALNRLEAALAGGERIASHLKAADVRRLLYRLGRDTFRDRVRLAWAAAPRSQPALAWRLLLAMADSWERPRFPLSGYDVMAAGVPAGPKI